jgi:hypothetical protein
MSHDTNGLVLFQPRFYKSIGRMATIDKTQEIAIGSITKRSRFGTKVPIWPNRDLNRKSRASSQQDIAPRA